MNNLEVLNQNSYKRKAQGPGTKKNDEFRIDLIELSTQKCSEQFNTRTGAFFIKIFFRLGIEQKINFKEEKINIKIVK